MGSDRIAVGLFIASFDAGGTEGQMLELATRLDSRRFNVRLACFSSNGPWASRAPSHVPVAEFPIESLWHPRTAAALRRFAAWCRRHDLSVVHTAGLYANIFGLTGAALARVSLRVASRRCLADVAHSPARRRLERLTYRLAHRVVTNSSAAGRLLAREGVAPDAIAMIPNGIDIAGRPVCSAAGRPEVIVVANLRREKGHDVLLDAASLVLATRPDVVFRIVGDGPLRRPIEAEAQRRGLGPAFEFLGFRSDVADLLAGAGVFVLPSRTEARPNALMEAMAAGLPIVATAVGDVPDLIAAPRNGLLVPPGDARALAAAMLSVLADPVRACVLGAAARAAVLDFTIERMVATFERLYLDALAGNASRRSKDTAITATSDTRPDPTSAHPSDSG